jgi:hypothetical protein
MNARSTDVFSIARGQILKLRPCAPAREQYPAYYIAGFSDKVSSTGG